MLTPELRRKIFTSLPVSFKTEVCTFGVHKEYAPYAKVTTYLKNNPKDIYMVLDFADDEVLRDETPINYVFNYDDRAKVTAELVEPYKTLNIIKGTRNQCQLNIHLYATWQPNTVDMIMAFEEVMNVMQSWVLFKLEKIVDYPRFNSIQTVDETEDRMIHRIISCTFAYTNVPQYTVDKESGNIVVDPKNPPEIVEHNVEKVELINALRITVTKVSPLPKTTIMTDVDIFKNDVDT